MNIDTSQKKMWPLVKSENLARPRSDAEDLKSPARTTTKQHDPNAEFYSREEAPWLLKNSKGEIHEAHRHISKEDNEVLKDRYLSAIHDEASETLRTMFDSFHSFKQQVSYTNPELAKKYFGFTLGFDQQIKVTDPDKVLTPAEVGYLTEQLNNRKGLQEDVRTHARLLMTLNDHDRKNFPDRHKLNLENYSRIIDYGQLFTRNTIGSFLKVLNYQLERYAEKIDEKKPDSRIDVRA
ncbi:MAG: hypothetical protein K0R45_832 [Pseudomonas sp.]|nr:hypothetical protein [Pseudomonas sp.]